MSSKRAAETSTNPDEAQVKSPCVSLCALNEDDICVGCYRSLKEISGWVRYDNREKREVLRRCAKRARLNNPFT